MIHLPDDMLLAYVRRQQRNLWTPSMQEHLDMCPVCKRRCTEFKMTGDVLEAWAHSSAIDPTYATVSNRVMHTLYEPNATPIEYIWSSISRLRVVLPVAVVVGLLFAILLVGVRVNMGGNGATSPKKVPPAPHIVMQPTATQSKPTPTSSPKKQIVTPVPGDPIGTATTVPGGVNPRATLTPQNVPYIQVEAPCTTFINVIQNQLHVCGNNFTPNTTVTIYYHIGTSSKKHTAQVGSDGTFNDMLYIQSCSDVPGSVYVQNSTNPPETAKIAKNITFGTCQGFGEFKKSKNNL